MPGTEEPRTKRTKFSRKTKKGWQKIDISQEEAALEQKRFEEIHFGGDLSKTKDEDLFVIDRKPVLKKKKELDRSKLNERNIYFKIKLVIMTKFWRISRKSQLLFPSMTVPNQENQNFTETICS